MKRALRVHLKSVAAIGILGVYLVPLYWMVVSALKSRAELYSVPPTLFPSDPQFAAFVRVISDGAFTNVLNSFVIGVSTVLFTLLVAAPSAWALARITRKWVRYLVLLFLMAQMMPTVLMATPLFVIFRSVGLVNTYFAVVLANATVTIPFAVIVLRTVFMGVPQELEESALIDGCTMRQVLFKVVVPVGKAGLVIGSVMAFILAWGDFIYANTMLSNASLHPATVAMLNYIGAQSTDWSAIMAFATVIALPLIIVFVALQKHVVQGLAAGALKV